MNKPVKRVLLFALLPIVIVGLYPLSVIFRVSVAEAEQFGKSTLIPLSFSQPSYTQVGTAASFNDRTYSFVRKDGRTIKVYKQLINGFQHAYGSALADYELGNHVADWIFRANEYVESYIFCRKTAGTANYSLDTRKDLANNAIGRTIGRSARRLNLTGTKAYQYILVNTLIAVDSGEVFSHYQDPRVAQLPVEEQFGCPGLYLTNHP